MERLFRSRVTGLRDARFPPARHAAPADADVVRGYEMVFTMVLGVLIGVAAVLLLQQWARDSLRTSTPVLPRERFPRLAPSHPPGLRVSEAPSLRFRRAA